uniref:Si:cabz01007807.1 n=1 Tax=Neogobius melanostomus TaxID=47308 RepID=A0A8C6SDM4_9GOBI
MNDDYSEKSSHLFAGYDDALEAEERKSKTPKRTPLLRKQKAIHVTPEQAAYLNSPQHDFDEDDEIAAIKGKHARSPAETYNYDEDQLDICEPKKASKFKAFKHKLKSKSSRREESPGATSSDYMSEAAKAELMAAEKDRNAMDEFADGEGDDGDTDSLMEWWNNVEQWDEVPSDEEEMILQKDESKSFSILADKVQHALRLFNKVFMERAEILWQSVITLHTIADDISTFHHKARIAGITGGTTTAVGGVAAVAGLALAPLTFGVSLIVTAVGVGIAAAGGITSASAAISDNVNNANDRKKVEELLLKNEDSLLELSKILHFSNTGLSKLRGHPFLRSGTQHYSQDWGVRQAVQVIGTMDTPVRKATDFIDLAVNSIQGLFQGIDKYFHKDTRELKKGCKSEIVAEIKGVANVLNDCIVELNGFREEVQEAMGEV